MFDPRRRYLSGYRGRLGDTIELTPENMACIRSGRTVADCLGFKVPKPGEIQPTQPTLPTTLGPNPYISVPADSPLLTAPAPVPWMQQKMFPGVKNQYLLYGGGGLLLLGLLAGGRRRR